MKYHPLRRAEKIAKAINAIEERNNKNMHEQLIAAKAGPLPRKPHGRSIRPLAPLPRKAHGRPKRPNN